MKILVAIFLSATLGLSAVDAQNFYHVKLDSKDECIPLLNQLAQQFGLENSTFSVRMSALPKGTNAIIEYAKVDATDRHMFLIILNRFHRGESITTSLIHEMVHAKQYYYGELVRYDRTDYMWNGKRYRNVSFLEHHRRPWEIEAHQMAHSMMAMIANHNNLSYHQSQQPKKQEVLARQRSR